MSNFSQQNNGYNDPQYGQHASSNPNNPPHFDRSNQTFSYQGGTHAAGPSGNVQGAAFNQPGGNNNAGSYSSLGNSALGNSYNSLGNSSLVSLSESNRVGANAVHSLYSSLGNMSTSSQQPTAWNNHNSQPQQYYHQNQPHQPQQQQQQQVAYQPYNQTPLHVQHPPLPPPPPPAYHNISYMQNNAMQSGNGNGFNASNNAQNTGYALTQNSLLQVAIPPPPPPPPPFIHMGAPSIAAPTIRPPSRSSSTPIPTHDISRQSENPYSDCAVAKRRRRDNRVDSDRQTHNLERVENQVDRRHVKGRDFRNESAPKKVSITLQQSNSGAKKTSENNAQPMPPSASIAAALVSGTSNFHLATLGRIPIDSENANITATKTNGSGKQIDNAMGALSVLESRWSSSQQKGPPPGPGKNSKKNKKRKRKKKILNDAINENMTNKAPIVVIKEPEPVTAVAPAAEQNRGGSRHEAIDLTSPDGGRESERAKCDHNGDLISSKEVQLTYASVLKKASDHDSVPIPTESPAPDITMDNHNSTFEERNRVLRKESVDDEMDISDEEEEESNGNTVANNDEATSKSVESLYEDLPNDLLTDRINSWSNVAKLESQLLDSKSNIAAPTDSTGTNQAINDASKLSEKERRTLKLAELRAKAKLASAKLRMAMQRKARGNASNELGDTKTDADHLTHRTFGLPSQRSVQNSLQNFKPLSVPPTSTKLPDITAMSQKFNLIIPDVALTGPANKVRFVDSVYELSSDDNDDDDGMKGGYQLLDEILDKGTEADLPSSSTETNNSSTISPIDPQEIKSLHPKGEISELNENQKKSESLKQQLNLAKLRLELKKKQQLLLAKKKLSQESSNAPSLEDKREVDCTIGSLMDPKQESTIEQRRILLHKLREKEQALLARKQRLLTGDTPTNNETIDHPVEKSISSDVEVGESKNTSVPKSIDEKSVEPAQGSISAISETLEPLPSLEQKHEKLEQLRRRQRELKQRNEVSNLRNLIMRQRDLLRAQGQELIESSSQLEACTNEIMSKQSMLEASEQRLQEMNHRKRIIEGMVFRATEKLMTSRKALNQRKQELNTK